MDTAFDLVILGFGPTALSLAIALREQSTRLNVLVLERKSSFSWRGANPPTHGARMKTSLLQDLVTQRDPKSDFTFLNYLRSTGSLVDYTNLSLINPPKGIFSHYLEWAASKIEASGWVRYNHDVSGLEPDTTDGGVIRSWRVVSKETRTGTVTSITAKRVLVAVGSQAKLPAILENLHSHPSVLHADRYQELLQHLGTRTGTLNVAVLGGGDVAVEIFEQLSSSTARVRVRLYPDTPTLRQTDSNPFLSSAIQKPGRLPYELQSRLCTQRELGPATQSIESSVISRLYLSQYSQLVKQRDVRKHSSRICVSKTLISAQASEDRSGIILRGKDITTDKTESYGPFDYVIAATGHVRLEHKRLTSGLRDLFDNSDGNVSVDSNYRVNFKRGKVAPQSGLWILDGFESESGETFAFMALRTERVLRSLMAESQTNRALGEEGKVGGPTERATL